MNIHFKVLALFAILIGVSPVFALSTEINDTNTIFTSGSAWQITVTTDKASYSNGDKITISGMSRDYIPKMPISIIIRNPIGNIVYINQVDLNTNKTYSDTISTGGVLWQLAGAYNISVQFGGQDRIAQTSFEFSGSGVLPQSNILTINGTNFLITYTITGGQVQDIRADTQAKSLIISIQTDGDGILNMTLPRSLIDSRIGGQDEQFFVLNDDQESYFQETNTTNMNRTISIPFEDGTEQIEVVGTQVVPEFGPIAALVLAIAIISIIAVSAKTGLRFMPKY